MASSTATKRPLPSSSPSPSPDTRENSTSGAASSSSSSSPPAKKAKTHPLFAPRTSKTSLIWHPPIESTCLHASFFNPPPRSKIAAYDLDGTLILPKGKGPFPSAKDPFDYKFWEPAGAAKVKERLQALHEQGYAIVIFTNQMFKGKTILNWKEKMKNFAQSLAVPFRVFAATGNDRFRKPRIGMWDVFAKDFNGGESIDLSSSFYIGDAAGRPRDHNDTDRKFALNVGLSFQTPEQHFLDAPPEPYTLKGYRPPRDPIHTPLFTPTATPLVPVSGTSKPVSEVVLFVGPPASGKTTFFRRFFEPKGYHHVNQDKLKTRERCLKEVDRIISEGGACIVDNTNRDVSTRSAYIELARKLDVPVRCIFFDASSQLAEHNNFARAFSPLNQDDTKRGLLPASAILSYFKQLEPPTVKEGYAETPKTVRFVFEGTEEERKVWERWWT